MLSTTATTQVPDGLYAEALYFNRKAIRALDTCDFDDKEYKRQRALLDRELKSLEPKLSKPSHRVPSSSKRKMDTIGEMHKSSDEEGLKGMETFVVDKILAERTYKGSQQFKVSWKGYDADHDSWEDECNFVGGKDWIREWREQQQAQKEPGCCGVAQRAVCAVDEETVAMVVGQTQAAAVSTERARQHQTQQILHSDLSFNNSEVFGDDDPEESNPVGASVLQHAQQAQEHQQAGADARQAASAHTSAAMLPPLHVSAQEAAFAQLAQASA